MEILYEKDGHILSYTAGFGQKPLPKILESTRFTAALGFFDGVHTGHAACLTATVNTAHENGTVPAVLTFRALDKKSLDGLLLTERARLARIFSFGIRAVFLLDFAEVSSLSTNDFVNSVLQNKLSVVHTLCGFNFRFGRGAVGTADTLSGLLPTTVCPPVVYGDAPVSATRIRAAVKAGDLPLAAALLGYPFSVSGVVTKGKQLGRALGFPTANIPLSPLLVCPPFGVYLTRATTEDGRSYYGVTNIGIRPTVEKNALPNAESHLFHCTEELYGKELTVAVLRFMRQEMRFFDREALSAQIEKDRRTAEEWITAYTEK